MIVLVTGGAASGKSEVAEGIAMRLGPKRAYVATMRPLGSEALARIDRHRRMREGKGFSTCELASEAERAALDFGVSSPSGAAHRRVALLECLGTLVSNELYTDGGFVVDPDEAFARVIRYIERLYDQCDDLVVVTNEVGSGDTSISEHLVPYVRLLGRVNNSVADWSDVVLEVVSGVPVSVKGRFQWDA